VLKRGPLSQLIVLQVFRSVFSGIECDRTVDAMWRICEADNPGLERSVPSTWHSLKSSGKYGLSMRGPCFDAQLVRNRQNEKLLAALSILIGAPILVSHDR
jgi:hypothetical protein